MCSSDLTSTIDGILAAFAIMSTDEFKKLKGVQNRSKQPNWYKENPEFSTIYNNQKYFNAFNELIKEINNNEINIHNGGDPLSGHNNNEIKKYKSTVILKGRKWEKTKKIFTLPISVTFDITKFVAGIGLFLPVHIATALFGSSSRDIGDIQQAYRDYVFGFNSTKEKISEIKQLP